MLQAAAITRRTRPWYAEKNFGGGSFRAETKILKAVLKIQWAKKNVERDFADSKFICAVQNFMREKKKRRNAILTSVDPPKVRLWRKPNHGTHKPNQQTHAHAQMNRPRDPYPAGIRILALDFCNFLVFIVILSSINWSFSYSGNSSLVVLLVVQL